MILNCTGLTDIINDTRTLCGMRVSEIAANAEIGATPYASPAAQIIREILSASGGKKVIKVVIETE